MEDLNSYSTAELLQALQAKERRENCKIRSAQDAVPHALKFASKSQEQFFVLLLDGAYQVQHRFLVSKGTANRTMCHPRDVYREAIRRNAVAIIIGHCHPSGNLEPSQEDREVTDRIREAGKIVGIQLLDHIVISHTGACYSFLEHNEI